MPRSVRHKVFLSLSRPTLFWPTLLSCCVIFFMSSPLRVYSFKGCLCMFHWNPSKWEREMNKKEYLFFSWTNTNNTNVEWNRTTHTQMHAGRERKKAIEQNGIPKDLASNALENMKWNCWCNECNQRRRRKNTHTIIRTKCRVCLCAANYQHIRHDFSILISFG